MNKIMLFILLFVCLINPSSAMQEVQKPDTIIEMPLLNEQQEREPSPDYTRMPSNSFWMDHPMQQRNSAAKKICACLCAGYVGGIISYYLYQMIHYHDKNL